jgi:hypothetical protein
VDGPDAQARYGTEGELDDLLSRLDSVLPDRDWRWGTATARQRLRHRLSAVAVAADQPGLTCLARTSQPIRDRVRRRWPGLSPLPSARGNPLTAR